MIRFPFVLACLAVMWCPHPPPDLCKALPTSEVSLLDGVQEPSKGSEVPISAKLEIDDGGASIAGIPVQGQDHVDESP